MTDQTVNDKHFSAENAAKYDTNSLLHQGHQVVSNILRYKNNNLAPATAELGPNDVNPFWAGKRVLDFACGTGITSLNFAPHVGQIVGIDIAGEMMKVFQHKLKPPTDVTKKVSAHLINLLEDDDDTINAKAGDDKMFDFDAVVSSLAYHHIDDIDATSRAIYHQLNKNGGWAFVADLSKDPNNVIPRDTEVPHPNGFTGAELEETFRQAGFVNIDSSYSFVIDELWETEEKIAWIGKNHVLSQHLPPLESDKHLSPAAIGLDKKIEGVRVYDVKEQADGGEPLYMFRMKFNVVVGQRLEK